MDGTFEPRYLPTQDMVADVLTKNVSYAIHDRLTKEFMWMNADDTQYKQGETSNKQKNQLSGRDKRGSPGKRVHFASPLEQ